MAFTVLSNPTVTINDETIKIVPNTLGFILGYGEINVRGVAGGGGSSETVHSVNPETRMGQVKFESFVTEDLSTKIQQWKQSIGDNVIKLTQTVNGRLVTRTFTGMSLTNDPEQMATSDGSAAFEFKGDPAV